MDIRIRSRREQQPNKWQFSANCTVDKGDHLPLILTAAFGDDEEEAIQKAYEDAMEKVFPRGL